MEKPLWVWGMFLGVIGLLLVLDLGVLHRKPKEMGVRESLWLSLFYIVIACGFGWWVWYYMGDVAGRNYFTGYVVEKTLSLDNIFVISLIFGYFRIPRGYQHRALFWGIMGVIVLRAVMIGAGAVLVERFSWVLYVFAVFLIYTGIKMMMVGEEASGTDIEHNKLLVFLRKHLRVTKELNGDAFMVKKVDEKRGGRKVWYFTPMFLALVLVETADVIFAVDSVPAIFAITQDSYVVYTSNIFAILGLRSLYFALAAIINRFHYLKYSMALVLVFIGGKVFAAHVWGEVPSVVSLGVTLGLLGGGVVYSLIKTRNGGGKV